MADPRHIVAVCGLFINEAGEVLLVKTPRRGWECPGGQVERAEALIEALVREVREESDCGVEVERLVGVYSNVGAPEKVVLMFQGRFLEGTPAPGEETLGAGWFSVEQAHMLVTNLPDAVRLNDALAFADRPVYRIYTNRPYVEISERRL